MKTKIAVVAKLNFSLLPVWSRQVCPPKLSSFLGSRTEKTLIMLPVWSRQVCPPELSSSLGSRTEKALVRSARLKERRTRPFSPEKEGEIRTARLKVVLLTRLNFLSLFGFSMLLAGLRLTYFTPNASEVRTVCDVGDVTPRFSSILGGRP